MTGVQTCALPISDVPVDAKAHDDKELITPLRRSFYSQGEDAGNHLASWLQRYVIRVQRDAGNLALRRDTMNRTNPKYVARNYLAQLAIDALVAGDSSVINRLVTVLQNPYDDQAEHDEFAGRRPEWARHKAGCSALSCSS